MTLTQTLAELPRLTVTELRQRYAEVFGETTHANNRVWLLRRIAWRLQAQAEGDLSERARRRAQELADDANLRHSPPKAKTLQFDSSRVPSIPLPGTDARLPPPGTVLTRKYKGATLQVKILPTGFEYEGEIYSSLSAVAKVITGTHCNGFAFFHLERKGGKS